jgi:Flp pilus assembly protein TadG
MKRNREAGQAIASVALGLVVLTGIVGLAIDMGYLRYEKRRMQSAADSAAIAGASELAYSTGNYLTAAKNDSKANGFEDGVNGVTVTSSNPPVDAPFSSVANASSYVEVRVHQDVPTFFMRVFGVNTASLNATAVAELGSSPGCVYSLGLLGIGTGINVPLGGSSVTAQNCGVVDNSLLSLGGCITAATISTVQPFGGGCATPHPIDGIVPANDPLGYITAPAIPGGCTFPTTVVVNSPLPTLLIPGVYCGGIQIAATNTGAVTFQTGAYFLTGAPGLSISGSGSESGTGVFFYIAGSASVQIMNTATGGVILFAPTSSPLPGVPGGILFFQDRGNGNPGILQAPNMALTGALYFLNAPLSVGTGGGMVSGAYSIFVAQSISFDGTITINSDYSSLANGSPIKAAFLVQ